MILIRSLFFLGRIWKDPVGLMAKKKARSAVAMLPAADYSGLLEPNETQFKSEQDRLPKRLIENSQLRIEIQLGQEFGHVVRYRRCGFSTVLEAKPQKSIVSEAFSLRSLLSIRTWSDSALNSAW